MKTLTLVVAVTGLCFTSFCINFLHTALANADTITPAPVSLNTLLVGIWNASIYDQQPHSGIVIFSSDGSYLYTDSVNPVHNESGTWSLAKGNVISMTNIYQNLSKTRSFYIVRSSATRIDILGSAPMILEK